ncbi:uncharacterized protein [Dysidea avara]|uniref:uncharacterized protein n=1 Tax=Dysidea avara TaxID=196820 RepID=UPI00331B1735
MTTSKSIGHTGGLAEMDYLPNSNSSEELASILNDYYDGPPSPPPVIMETQPEQSLWFSRYLGQQVPLNDHSSKLTSPPQMATSQKPSAIPLQNFVVYRYSPLVKPPPVLTNHTTPTLNQPLVSRGVDKRYPTPTSGVPKPSTSPILCPPNIQPILCSHSRSLHYHQNYLFPHPQLAGNHHVRGQ